MKAVVNLLIQPLAGAFIILLGVDYFQETLKDYLVLSIIVGTIIFLGWLTQYYTRIVSPFIELRKLKSAKKAELENCATACCLEYGAQNAQINALIEEWVLFNPNPEDPELQLKTQRRFIVKLLKPTEWKEFKSKPIHHRLNLTPEQGVAGEAIQKEDFAHCNLEKIKKNPRLIKMKFKFHDPQVKLTEKFTYVAAYPIMKTVNGKLKPIGVVTLTSDVRGAGRVLEQQKESIEAQLKDIANCYSEIL